MMPRKKFYVLLADSAAPEFFGTVERGCAGIVSIGRLFDRTPAISNTRRYRGAYPPKGGDAKLRVYSERSRHDRRVAGTVHRQLQRAGDMGRSSSTGLRAHTDMSIRSRCFFLLLTVSSISASHAATYYVRSGGDDSADGRTPATAWSTVGKVNSFSFSAGDSVLFHEGDTWTTKQLVIDWSGTSSSPATIGSYYVDASGKAQSGFKTARPTLDGAKKYPEGRYTPLVQVVGDRVRVQDLAIVNSQGRGINFEGTSSGQAVNLYLANTFDGSIKFMDSQDGLAERNTIVNGDRAWAEVGENWAGAIGALRSTGTIIRNNTIMNELGEGINCFRNSARCLIEGNYIFAARAVGIYVDASPQPTIRYNIVVGSADSKYWRSGDSMGAGIAINNENYHYESFGGPLSTSVQTSGAKIYGNLVAFTNTGVAIWGQLSSSSFDNTLIYNNTLVDNDTQFSVLKNLPMPGSQFINNILLSISSGTRDVDNASPKGLTAKNNYFSQGDPGGTLSSPGNKYKGLTLARMSGWRSITDPKSVSWRDFEVKSGSVTIGAGEMAPLSNATTTDSYDKDFNLKPYDSPPDLGALKFLSSPSKVPGKPVNLLTSTDES
jgi:hypothetical protein